MAFTVRDLLKLEVFKSVITLISNDTGMEKAVTWPYIKQTRELKPWLNGGEIIFVIGGKGETAPEEQLGLIKEGVENKVSAFVFLCGEGHIDKIDSSVIQYADSVNMPVFVMPYNTKLIDVTREITSAIIKSNDRERMILSFITDLLHRNFPSEEHITKQGYEFGINLGDSCTAVTIETDFEYETKDYSRIMSYRNSMSYILKGIEQLGIEYDMQIVTSFNMEKSVCLIFMNSLDRQREITDKIVEYLNYHFNYGELTFFCGFSSIHSGVKGCLTCVEESERAVSFAKKVRGRNVCRYDEMGILKLLINFNSDKELMDYCKSIVGVLIDSDKAQGTEYMLTVKTYLENNKSLVATANQLFIHRNTLINRIKKIEELTGQDLKNTDVMIEYMCVFKILEFLV